MRKAITGFYHGRRAKVAGERRPADAPRGSLRRDKRLGAGEAVVWLVIDVVLGNFDGEVRDVVFFELAFG